MTELERITLYRDELETLKLCDLDGRTQEEAGRAMGVSRGTVQRLVASGRRKVAMALTEGKALVFEDPVCASDVKAEKDTVHSDKEIS